MRSATERTLAWCRDQGWPCQVVESWIPQARRRRDLFGFGDVIALDGKPGSVLIQSTTGSHLAARRNKVRLQPEARLWLLAGNRILLVAWRKITQRKADGKMSKVKKWEPLIEEVKR